jgi:hypothetical protein
VEIVDESKFIDTSIFNVGKSGILTVQKKTQKSKEQKGSHQAGPISGGGWSVTTDVWFVSAVGN